MTFPYQKISFHLVSDLHPRTKDIVVQRFGLETAEAKTLEAIGKSYHITRERVRQIVEDGLSQTRERMQEPKEASQLKGVFAYFVESLAQAGNVKREDLLLDVLRVRDAANYVLFLLTLGDQFYNQRETQDFYPFWSLKKEMVDQAPTFHEQLLSFFEKQQAPCQETDLQSAYEKILAASTLYSFLEASKYIMRSHDGKWGLRTWPEINPKGVKDKAYVVLKYLKEPLHFTDVAKRIEQFQDMSQIPNKKRILSQTVHNELIKDPRFVLVGRGTYALSEWGYPVGTVKDVLLSILQEHDNPMTKEEIVDEILSKRKIKESTIELNLQNKECFVRNAEGKYSIKVSS